MSPTYEGRTQDASSPILGAGWWKKGAAIAGEVVGEFETTNGKCYQIKLDKPATVNGNQEKNVAIGNLAGFNMALQAAGIGHLEPGDKIKVICSGFTQTGKGTPRTDFSIQVNRG